MKKKEEEGKKFVGGSSFIATQHIKRSFNSHQQILIDYISTTIYNYQIKLSFLTMDNRKVFSSYKSKLNTKKDNSYHPYSLITNKFKNWFNKNDNKSESQKINHPHHHHHL